VCALSVNKQHQIKHLFSFNEKCLAKPAAIRLPWQSLAVVVLVITADGFLAHYNIAILTYTLRGANIHFQCTEMTIYISLQYNPHKLKHLHTEQILQLYKTVSATSQSIVRNCSRRFSDRVKWFCRSSNFEIFHC